MNPLSLISLLLNFGYLCCFEATADRSQDPQQVDAWIIRQNPSLQFNHIANHVEVFKNPYQKHEFKDLNPRQRDYVLALVFQFIDPTELKSKTIWQDIGSFAPEVAQQFVMEHPGTRWNGEHRNNEIQVSYPTDLEIDALWKRLLIWKQNEQNNYIISSTTHWIIGAGNNGNERHSGFISDVFWSSRMHKRDQPPGPSQYFPELINEKLTATAPISELYGKFREMERENERLTDKINIMDSEMHRLSATNQQLAAENQKVNERLRARERQIEEHEARISILEKKNQGLNERINEMYAETKRQYEEYQALKGSNMINQQEVTRNVMNNEMEMEWTVMMRNHSELLRDAKHNQRLIAYKRNLTEQRSRTERLNETLKNEQNSHLSSQEIHHHFVIGSGIALGLLFLFILLMIGAICCIVVLFG